MTKYLMPVMPKYVDTIHSRSKLQKQNLIHATSLTCLLGLSSARGSYTPHTRRNSLKQLKLSAQRSLPTHTVQSVFPQLFPQM